MKILDKRIYFVGVLILGLLIADIARLVHVGTPTPMAASPSEAPTPTPTPTPTHIVSELEIPCDTYTILYNMVPHCPTAPPEPEPEPRYGFTDDEIYLLAQLLCGSGKVDGDGEYDIDFQKNVNHLEVGKVLSVVMNRVRSEGMGFPNTVKEVVLQSGQFTVMPRNSKRTPSEKALQIVRDWCTAYDLFDPAVQVCPEDHLYFRSGPKHTNVTRKDY